MIEPTAKRALTYALFAAVAHSAAWAGYVTYLQNIDFQKIEQSKAVIVWLDFSNKGHGMPPSRFHSLHLKLQPLVPADAPIQLVSRINPRPDVRAYFERHRPGDIVDSWVGKRSGRIVDIFPPEPPDFWRLYRVLLPTLGLVTFLVMMMIFVLNMAPRVEPAN